MAVAQVVAEVAVMGDTITGVTLTMSRPAVAPPIISTGHRWMAVITVAVTSMFVVGEGVGLVLVGTTTGETALTTQKTNAGTAGLTAGGRYLVLV